MLFTRNDDQAGFTRIGEWRVMQPSFTKQAQLTTTLQPTTTSPRVISRPATNNFADSKEDPSASLKSLNRSQVTDFR